MNVSEKAKECPDHIQNVDGWTLLDALNISSSDAVVLLYGKDEIESNAQVHLPRGLPVDTHDALGPLRYELHKRLFWLNGATA